MSGNESTRHHDLLKAFDEAHCPVCRLVLRDSQKDIFNMFQDRINKVDTHLAFRAGRGLCNAHGWQMVATKGSAITVAVMYESTVFELLKHANQIGPGASGFGRLLGGASVGAAAADKLEPTGDCILCAGMNRSEEAYLEILATQIRIEEMRRKFAESPGGLCLPHVRLLLRKLNTAQDVRWLLDLQKDKWQNLQDSLKSFIEKNEQNIPHWNMGADGDSWQRAVRYLSGDPEVFGYRRGVT